MSGEEKRQPYAAMQSDGQNACVIGPGDEIIVEIVSEPREAQIMLAKWIAAMLNDPPNCGDRGDKARYLLMLVDQRAVTGDAIGIIADAIEDAGAQFARSMITVMERREREVPF